MSEDELFNKVVELMNAATSSGFYYTASVLATLGAAIITPGHLEKLATCTNEFSRLANADIAARQK